MREVIRKEIISATVECIEKEGIHNVTVRKIAQKAGVNFAAVNYYFGSKENLIRETIKATSKDSFEKNWSIYREERLKNPKDALNKFLSLTLEHMFQYRELTKASFSESVKHEHHCAESLKEFNDFLDSLFISLEDVLPDSDVLEKKFLIIQMLSAVFLPGLFPGMFRDFIDSDFSRKSTQKEYIRTLVNRLLEQNISS